MSQSFYEWDPNISNIWFHFYICCFESLNIFFYDTWTYLKLNIFQTRTWFQSLVFVACLLRFQIVDHQSVCEILKKTNSGCHLGFVNVWISILVKLINHFLTIWGTCEHFAIIILCIAVCPVQQSMHNNNLILKDRITFLNLNTFDPLIKIWLWRICRSLSIKFSIRQSSFHCM